MGFGPGWHWRIVVVMLLILALTACENFGKGDSSFDPESLKVIDLTVWLASHPAVRAKIIWESAEGPRSFPDWSLEQQRELQAAFQVAALGQSIAMADSPENLAKPADDQFPTTVIGSRDAWTLYIAHVARTLAVETGRLVAWSLEDYVGEDMAWLLDSRAIFHWDNNWGGYQFYSFQGGAIPAPIELTLKFLKERELVGPTRLKTIANVLEWARGNLQHMLGPQTTKVFESHWRYRGFPLLSRLIEGTVLPGYEDWGARHWTAGCWGTLGYIKAVLQLVNIPVRPDGACGHVIPCFPGEGKCLTHGDDPYNGLTQANPPYPAEEMLVTEDQFNSWFGDSVPDEEKCANVGRQVRENAIRYLPNVLLLYRCLDLASGQTKQSGQVYQALGTDYSVAQLDARKLWERIDEKVAALGGCSSIR